MADELVNPSLSIGFLDEHSSEARQFVVPVTELSQVLDAFQRSVFASAAYDLYLPNTRRLTDLQRKQYTLAVVSFRQGSLWADLMPLAFAALVTYQQSGTLFPPEVLKEIGVESMMRAWDAVKRAFGVMKKQFDGEDQEPGIDRVIGRYTAEVAKAALQSGQSIEIVHKDSSGSEFSFRTTPVSSQLVLDQRKGDPELFGTFEDLVVKDIMTSSPFFNVAVPNQPQNKIKCIYPKGQESIYGQHLGIGQRITVSGTAVWTDPDNLSDIPNKIVVSRVVMSDGTIIGQSRFEQSA